MTRPRPLPRLAYSNPAPVVTQIRKPLISSEARRNESQGKRPYDCKPLQPKQIPATFRLMTAYPKRVRAAPCFWTGVAWAVLPSLIGGALFLAVVGVFVGLVP